MREPVGRDGWYLCEWSDQPDHEYTEFRGSKPFVLQWADQLRGDFSALCTARHLLGSRFPPRSDDQIVQEVAWRLTSGAWVARRRVVKRGTAVSSGGPQEAVAFPKENRRSAAPPAGPDPEAPLFPGDIDTVAIAEAQKRAAALGIPFCEECLRAQMQTTTV